MPMASAAPLLPTANRVYPSRRDADSEPPTDDRPRARGPRVTAARVGLLAVAAVAIAAVLWLRPAPVAAPSEPSRSEPAATGAAAAAEPAAAPVVAPVVATSELALPPERQPPVAGRELAAAAAAPQGLRGRVVASDGRALGGLPVYLVDSAMNEPLALTLLHRQGDAFRPLVSATSAADGTFALGLLVAQDRAYEVYVTSPAHATARIGGLAITTGRWHDLGDVTMAPGATVRGRATVAGRPDIPVAGAVITITIGTVFADAALRALPDAGQGLVATTAADGSYELAHVPGQGVVQASAVAKGFARQLKTNLELKVDAPIEVDFALLPGQAIHGKVVDADGSPVAQARVEAWPTEASGEPLAGVSSADGTFEVLGLGQGKHAVKAARRGYHTATVAGVDSGRAGVTLTLRPLARVRARVVAADNAPIRRFRVGLRRVFVAQGGQIAAVADVPDRSVALTGGDDAVDIDGVPFGEFCLQVEADGFAKTLSAPFANPEDGPDQPRSFDVVVTMGQGATVRGRIVAEDGAPLAGATVQTAAAGIPIDSPFYRMLAGATPDRITATTVRSDADGWFALVRLAPGDYQLLVDHPDACRTTMPDLRLEAGARNLPPLTLPTGARVAGRATVGGKPAPQMKVVLSTPPAQQAAAGALRIEAVTDPDGAFTLPRRVPPGAYELRAARAGSGAPEAHVLHAILELQRTAVAVAIAPGQREIRADIDLPSDH